jgi:hypothetical protein
VAQECYVVAIGDNANGKPIWELVPTSTLANPLEQGVEGEDEEKG